MSNFLDWVPNRVLNKMQNIIPLRLHKYTRTMSWKLWAMYPAKYIGERCKHGTAQKVGRCECRENEQNPRTECSRTLMLGGKGCFKPRHTT